MIIVMVFLHNVYADCMISFPLQLGIVLVFNVCLFILTDTRIPIIPLCFWNFFLELTWLAVKMMEKYPSFAYLFHIMNWCSSTFLFRTPLCWDHLMEKVFSMWQLVVGVVPMDLLLSAQILMDWRTLITSNWTLKQMDRILWDNILILDN